MPLVVNKTLSQRSRFTHTRPHVARAFFLYLFGVVKLPGKGEETRVVNLAGGGPALDRLDAGQARVRQLAAVEADRRLALAAFREREVSQVQIL